MSKSLSFYRWAAVALLCTFTLSASLFAQAPTSETVEVDATGPATLLPHFWEHIFGSGRAILSLRESYRDDLRAVKAITDMQYVRFHAIFHDEVGVYDEDARSNPVFNFSYVDQIYDGLLSNGVRPFVELSFMPRKLAAKDALHAFWYKQNVSPPKDYAKWDEMIKQFAKHLIDRYGIDEVSQWYFEVWNEPNIDFWVGDPKQATYFELYDHTAHDLKAVSTRLRVGGPATAQAAWAVAFIRHCVDNKIPVDFVSSHVYGNDTSEDIFGTHEKIPRDQMVCRAIGKVHEQIKSSPLPSLPLIWSEFNASYMNEPAITDSVYMGPWLAGTIRQCDGLVQEMSYWTFSDVFEEQGVLKQPFYGGYGLIAAGGIPKPSFNAFRLLHQLGEQRLANRSESVLVTRRRDGTVVIAAWNLSDSAAGVPKQVQFHFQHVNVTKIQVSRLDSDHGDVHKAYEAMGSPRYPTREQIEKLRLASQLPAPVTQDVRDSCVTLTIPAEGLVLLETKPAN